MTNTDKSMCDKLNMYFDGELDGETCKEFQSHLESCEECRDMLSYMESIRTSLKALGSIRIPDEAELRIRRNFNSISDLSWTKDEILDIEGLARFLKLSVPEIVDMLDQLPSFEVGGRIRFRRDRIIGWIKDQEKKLVRDREQHALPSYKNIVQFRGGKQ